MGTIHLPPTLRKQALPFGGSWRGLLLISLVLILPSLGGGGGGFLYAQNFLWGRSGGSTGISDNSFNREAVYDIATDRSGNVYLISPVKNQNLQISGQPLTGYGGSDIMLASYKPDGTLRWVKMIGGSGNDNCYNLCTDDKDGVYVSGNVYKYNSPAHIDTDATSPKNNQHSILVKYDTAGKYQWFRYPEPDTMSSLISTNSVAMDVDNSGNVYWLMNLAPGGYAGGALTVTTTGIYLLKYSASGAFSYIKPDLDINGSVSMSMTIDETNGRFYLSGTNQGSLTMGGNAITGTMYIGCYKLDGSFVWKRESTSGFGGFSSRAVIDGLGNIYLAGSGNDTTVTHTPPTRFNGYTINHGNGNTTPFIVKMDKNGNNIWARDAEATVTSWASAVALRTNNEVIITGTHAGAMNWTGYTPGFSNSTNYDAFITRFDAYNGTVLGMDKISSNFGEREYPTCMASDGNGHVYIGGHLDGFMYVTPQDTIYNSGGDMDWFVVKYGDMWPASVDANTAINTVKIYPNPATDRLIIESAEACTELSICNMLGQRVFHGSTLNGNKVIDVSMLSAGNYLVQITRSDGSRNFTKLVKQ